MVDFIKPPWFEEGPAEAVDHQTTVMGRTPAYPSSFLAPPRSVTNKSTPMIF
jgi:hypothetical protein